MFDNFELQIQQVSLNFLLGFLPCTSLQCFSISLGSLSTSKSDLPFWNEGSFDE